jgi:hypothetical protein
LWAMEFGVLPNASKGSGDSFNPAPVMASKAVATRERIDDNRTVAINTAYT